MKTLPRVQRARAAEIAKYYTWSTDQVKKTKKVPNQFTLICSTLGQIVWHIATDLWSWQEIKILGLLLMIYYYVLLSNYVPLHRLQWWESPLCLGVFFSAHLLFNSVPLHRQQWSESPLCLGVLFSAHLLSNSVPLHRLQWPESPLCLGVFFGAHLLSNSVPLHRLRWSESPLCLGVFFSAHLLSNSVPLHRLRWPGWPLCSGVLFSAHLLSSSVLLHRLRWPAWPRCSEVLSVPTCYPILFLFIGYSRQRGHFVQCRTLGHSLGIALDNLRAAGEVEAFVPVTLPPG